MVLIQCCLYAKDQPANLDEEEEEEETEAEKEYEVGSAQASSESSSTPGKPLPKGVGRVHTGPGLEVRVEWNAQKWGRTLGLMFRKDALRDYGRHFKEAVAKLSHNIPPHQTGSKSEGMGAAMRIGISFFFFF
jgi:hypothetical protein